VTLRGSTGDFPLESVIGLLAGTSKTGELQVRSGAKVGALGFAGGRLVAAVMEGEGGENALGAVFAMPAADFVFTPWETAPDANLEAGDLVSLLKRAAEARDRITAIRASIPDDHMRFKLSEKAADQGAVTFTPERWRALLAVNGERDVIAVADQLRLPKMQALTLLAGLVKDGIIEALPARESRAEAPAATSRPERSPSPEPEREPAPPVAEWSSSPPASEWSPSPPTSPETPAPPFEAPAEPEPEQASEWRSGGTDWAPQETPAPPTAEPPRPSPAVREDLQAEIAQRMGGFGPVPEPSAPPVDVPPAVDDRLSSLSGLFAPGPAADATAEPPAKTERRPAAQPSAPSGPPAESWMTAPPAAKEAPANAWAPGAPPKEAPKAADPWSAPVARPEPESPPTRATPSRTDEWAPPPQPAAPEAEKKKGGGFFGRFRRDETPTPIAHIEPASSATTKTGKLASLSNALLMEYNSGGYGRGKIETRLSNLLMRVDEQADPIDKPLPVVDDMIDAAALEREGFDERQAVPYLATLVRQIYEDAERAFGKDKARKGYKAAQQQVFGGDPNALQSPELAGKLPKV
jgi:hypothetical protein